MTAPELPLLNKLYSYAAPFYLLIRPNGIIVVESPKDQEEPRDPPETVLRLFMSVSDADTYRSRSQFSGDARVQKTTLVGLWALLEKLNEISESQFKCPVAVEVSAVNARGEVVTVDVLHSRNMLPA